MSLLVIGSVAFDAIETPFGKTDKIIGGAATYISLSASYFKKPVNLVAVVGGDFPKADVKILPAQQQPNARLLAAARQRLVARSSHRRSWSRVVLRGVPYGTEVPVGNPPLR